MTPVRPVLVALALWIGLPLGAPAQDPASTPRPQVESSASREASAYRLPPEKYRQAIEYSRAKYRLHFVGFAWGIVVLLALLRFRIVTRFRDLAERASRKLFGQALVFVSLVLVTLQLLSLPIDLYRHGLALFYEQSVQPYGSWLWDWTKAFAIGLAIAVSIGAAIHAIVRKHPRRWWLLFWLGSLPVIVFLVFLSPLVIDPLFFEFEPLAAAEPGLVEQIERVTRRGGLEIPRERMFLMKASEKLKSVNAYVTGFGASKRVVVWDTTLAKMTVPEALFVFGHEMGHYVLGHVFQTIAFLAVVLLVLLFLAHRITERLFRDGRRPFGIRGLPDWAALPLLLLLLTGMGELALPVANAYSRTNEHAADVYGLEAIHGIVPDSNRAAAEAFQRLGEINLADPSPPPLVRFWLYSHPPIAERIAFARGYDPWSAGRQPRFVKTTPAR